MTLLLYLWLWMLVFDHSVDPSPSPRFPSTSPCPSLHPSPPSSHPSLLPSSSPVDHADADREQRAAGGPAGWGGSWPWGRGAWRGGRRRPLGWDARRNWWRGSGWIRARSGPPRALGALLGRPPLPSPSEGPPGLLNVRARGGPRPHGPWSPSPGLPGSPPAAPQHTQCKLELPPAPFPLPTSHLPFGGPDWWVIGQSLSLYFSSTLSLPASQFPIFLFERSTCALSPI